MKTCSKCKRTLPLGEFTNREYHIVLNARIAGGNISISTSANAANNIIYTREKGTHGIKRKGGRGVEITI
jgi:hypothetical protein